MAVFPFSLSFSRNKPIPLDDDSIKTTHSSLLEYAKNGGVSYVGEIVSVTGDTEDNNGAYIITAIGENGSVEKIGTGVNTGGSTSNDYVEDI